MRYQCLTTLNKFPLRPDARVLDRIPFLLLWEVNIAQELLLGVFAPFGNLLRQGKDAVDDLKLIVMESPQLPL